MLHPALHAPIVNQVLAVAHISKAWLHTVVTRNPGGGMTNNGYTPLDTCRLWVTDDVSPPILPFPLHTHIYTAHKVSMIVQFCTIDYRMENITVSRRLGANVFITLLERFVALSK
jgi:hypothetical protein